MGRKSLISVGFWTTMGVALAIITCITVCTSLGALGACSNSRWREVSKVGANYKDQTPAAEKLLQRQNTDTKKAEDHVAAATTANTDAHGFLSLAASDFVEFWSLLPAADPRPATIVDAQNKVQLADGRLTSQLLDLQAAKSLQDGVVKSQQDTIKILAGQTADNAVLRADDLAKAGQIVQLQGNVDKLQAKLTKEEGDFFGRARHWWHAFKWFCVFSIPVILLLGYLGVRYGADKISAPIAGGIGGIIGAGISGIRVGAYWLGTIVMHAFPVVGAWLHSEALKVKAWVAHTKKTAAVPAAPVVEVASASAKP